MDDWHRIDNSASTILWLDHSISAWSITETQWHLNEYSAITLQYLDNEGNVRPHYVTGDNGIEHDHNRQWHFTNGTSQSQQSTMVSMS
eukprot:2491873-Amphidinium_carterae.1